MRCLYCGNELALLKKLTGGGEFCSEAHRQKYQEEYNRLALSRLLQAQPVQGERPPLDAVRQRGTKADSEASLPAPSSKRPGAVPASAPLAAAVSVAEPSVAAPAYTNGNGSRSSEPPIPPYSGFMLDRFEPVLSPRDIHSSEPFLTPVGAFLPNLTNRAFEVQLPTAEGVLLPNMQYGWNMKVRTVERQVDARDFTRVAPPIQLPIHGLQAVSPLPVTSGAVIPALAGKLFEVAFSLYEHSCVAVVAEASWSHPLLPEFRLNAQSLIAVLTDENREQPPADLVRYPDADETETEVSTQDVVVEEELTAEPVIEPPAPATPPLVAEGLIAQAAPEPESLAVQLEPDTSAVKPVLAPEPPEAAVESEPAAAELELSVDPELEVAVEPEPSPIAQPEPLAAIVPEPVVAIAPEAERPRVTIDMSIFGELQSPEKREPVKPKIAPAAVVVTPPAMAAPPAPPAPDPIPVAEIPEVPKPTPEIPVPATSDATEAIEPEPTAATPELVAQPEAEMAAVASIPSRIPRLADAYLKVQILPLSPAFAQQGELTPPVAPTNFRVAAPTLDGVSVRPKMVYGARPEVKTVSTSDPVPAAAAPELPPTVLESGASSSRRDPRNENAMPEPVAGLENSSPSSETPAKVAAPEAQPIPPAPQPVAAAPKASSAKSTSRSTGTSLNLEDLRLGLEQQSELGSPLSAAWSRMAAGKRVAVGLGFVLALFIAGLLLRSTFASKPATVPPTATEVEAVGSSLITTAGSWTSDWSGAGANAPQISLFRPSQVLSDYRIEFQGQIESKSIGWVFRAINPKNYYGTRLEIAKAGLQPTINVVHYALINGEETQVTATPLPFPVHIDTVYKVRSDIFGSQFKTYIQGKLVDSWSDDRLKTGGFGLLTERGDRSQVRLVQLFELRAGK